MIIKVTTLPILLYLNTLVPKHQVYLSYCWGCKFVPDGVTLSSVGSFLPATLLQLFVCAFSLVKRHEWVNNVQGQTTNFLFPWGVVFLSGSVPHCSSLSISIEVVARGGK